MSDLTNITNNPKRQIKYNKMNEQARVARIVSLMNDHNASSPQAENKHTISTNVYISIIYSSLSAEPTNPTAHRRVSPHHPPQPKIGSAPKVKERRTKHVPHSIPRKPFARTQLTALSSPIFDA